MRSAAFFAAGHDGGVKAFAEVGGEFVDFVGAVNFYRFTGGVEDDFAVAALIHVLFDFGAQRRGNGVVDEIVVYKAFVFHIFAVAPYRSGRECANLTHPGPP